MQTFILMSIALAAIVSLTYLFSRKMKGKQLFSPSMWVFYLIEKIFDENDSSTEGVKENGMSQANPGQNKDG